MTSHTFTQEEQQTIEKALQHAYEQVSNDEGFRFQVTSVTINHGDDPKHPMIKLEAEAPMHQHQEEQANTQLQSSIAYIPLEEKTGKLLVSGFLDAYIGRLQEALADIFTRHGFEVYVDQAFSYEW